MTVSIRVRRLSETNQYPARLEATCENGRTCLMSIEACTNEHGFLDVDIIVNRLLWRCYNQLVAYEKIQFRDEWFVSTTRKRNRNLTICPFCY